MLRGNAAPHFTITADVLVSGHMIAGGAMHDTIVEHFPQFADLVALHLSDHNGVPMHAEANGAYYLRECELSTFDNHMRFTPADVPALVSLMRPVWKAQAEACIRHHHLRTFGDLSALPEGYEPTNADALISRRGYDMYGRS